MEKEDCVIRVGKLSHTPDWDRVKVAELLHEAVKEAAALPNALPSEIAQHLKARADEECVAVLPKTKSHLHLVSRSQHEVQETDPSSLEDLVKTSIPDCMSSVNGEKFVLRKTSSLLILGEKRWTLVPVTL